MNFIYFIIFAILIFMSTLIGYKKFRSTTLYALAIGGIVNANFFHAVNYPINCFGLSFGIDSVIYTLFVFCVIVMLIKEDKKSAYLLAFSSIIAIMFSAIMQLVSDLLSIGSSYQVWATFLTFLVSSLASVVAVIVMLEILDRLKDKLNNYLLLILGTFIATIINSIIYYPLSLLIYGIPSNIYIFLLTTTIGKVIALLCGLLTLFIINKIDKNKQHQ